VIKVETQNDDFLTVQFPNSGFLEISGKLDISVSWFVWKQIRLFFLLFLKRASIK
jgi:hypothetical protein